MLASSRAIVFENLRARPNLIIEGIQGKTGAYGGTCPSKLCYKAHVRRRQRFRSKRGIVSRNYLIRLLARQRPRARNTNSRFQAVWATRGEIIAPRNKYTGRANFIHRDARCRGQLLDQHDERAAAWPTTASAKETRARPPSRERALCLPAIRGRNYPRVHNECDHVVISLASGNAPLCEPVYF